MKKQRFKKFSLGALALSMILNVAPIHTHADDVNMRTLKTQNSKHVITLRDNPIEVPDKMIQRKEQFRGVWVSTVYNLDFPSKRGISQEKYKEEYRVLLDNLEDLNMNSVIFQVRPKLDAFYKSDINPWSEYLSGKQGKNPGWDPMEWMVEEAHKRGMEFHAWFNPYRVTTSKENKKSIKQELKTLSEGNWARQNPQHVYRYAGKLQLKPDEPEVIDHIGKSIMEVVENYDIDAIHFDDYFYPFKGSSKFYFPGEKAAFEKQKDEFNSIEDWRRNNVDKLVEKLSTSIKEHNANEGRNVQFGISPFAIWGHQGNPEIANVGEGSHTPLSSGASYDQQFADTRKWVKNNWVDYIAPQVYWTFDQKAAPYGEIVHWWTEVVRDTDVNLYIGHANYKLNQSKTSSSWKNPQELCNQLNFNSKYDEVKGSIFFRYKDLIKSAKGNTVNDRFIDMLKKDYFNTKADLPSKSKLKADSKIAEVIKNKHGNLIVWKDDSGEGKDYTIYRETVDSAGRTLEKVELKTIRKTKDSTPYAHFDQDINEDEKYKYYVSENKAGKQTKIAYVE